MKRPPAPGLGLGTSPNTSARRWGNIVGDLQLANGGTWFGYWVKPAITLAQPDPDGGNRAIQLASADHGGGGGNRSGLLFRRAGQFRTGEVYRISFWGMSADENIDLDGVTFGLSDNHAVPGTVTLPAGKNGGWTFFEATITIGATPPEDNRVFQIYENTLANVPWLIYNPSVRRIA